MIKPSYRSPFALTALLVSVLAASTSFAATVVTPVSATAPDFHDAARTLTETIDGSGLSDVSDPGSVLDDIHIDHNSGGNSNTTYWLSSDGVPAATGYTLEYDLGGTFELSGIHLWQYSRSGDNDRGIQSFDLWVSSDGTSFTEGVTSSTLGNFTIGDNTEQLVQTKTFGTISGVTHVELRNLNNFGGTRYGLSELRFAAVPEPSTMALLLLLGPLALLRRRR